MMTITNGKERTGEHHPGVRAYEDKTLRIK
jgi:hypothetical protein